MNYIFNILFESMNLNISREKNKHIKSIVLYLYLTRQFILVEFFLLKHFPSANFVLGRGHLCRVANVYWWLRASRSSGTHYNDELAKLNIPNVAVCIRSVTDFRNIPERHRCDEEETMSLGGLE